MALESILIKFLIVITLIFFIPKVTYRFLRIPSPITEIALGISLALIAPHYFAFDDMLKVLATLGIITLFVHAGMEVDTRFMLLHRRFFIENAIRHLLVFLILGFLLIDAFKLPVVVAFIAAVALTTPSASYIISSLDKKDHHRKWIESKAIVGEVIGLALLVILLGLGDPWTLAFTIIVIAALILVLPKLLKFLYKHIFGRIVGAEFSFIFVVALLAAFVTESIGLHFLLGAFIAGITARSFLRETGLSHKEDVARANGITKGFGFFAATFIPFYFFSTGIRLEWSLFTLTDAAIAGGLCLGIAAINISTVAFHRSKRQEEDWRSSLRIAYLLTPTLVITFVIADILKDQFAIDGRLYAILMIYGLFTALLAFILSLVIGKHSSRKAAGKRV